MFDSRVGSGSHEYFIGRFAGCAGELDAEHGDIVVLAEGLGLLHDGGGGLIADGPGAVEAEELVLGVHGFDDAVGEKGETVTRLEGNDA